MLYENEDDFIEELLSSDPNSIQREQLILRFYKDYKGYVQPNEFEEDKKLLFEATKETVLEVFKDMKFKFDNNYNAIENWDEED